MPLVAFFIDEKILNQLKKYIDNKIFPDVQTAVLIAINYLVRTLQFCEENQIDLTECADKVVEFMLKKIHVS